MTVRALIFDCDGVLSDTERYGHLPAFNQTFREFGLPVQWSEDDYADKLRIGGGKERMASLLTPEFLAEAGIPDTDDAKAAALAEWHRRKTEIYTGFVADGLLPARTGIARLAREAVAAGFSLAVASTSAEPSVRAVLAHAVGPGISSYFRVFAGDIVAAKKPAPDIYELAVREMGVTPDSAVVVEDSENGLRAATAAGLRTIVTVSSYTEHENFDSAALVVSSLGDPHGEETEVLASAVGVVPHRFVRITDVIDVLTSPLPQSVHTQEMT